MPGLRLLSGDIIASVENLAKSHHLGLTEVWSSFQHTYGDTQMEAGLLHGSLDMSWEAAKISLLFNPMDRKVVTP